MSKRFSSIIFALAALALAYLPITVSMRNANAGKSVADISTHLPKPSAERNQKFSLKNPTARMQNNSILCAPPPAGLVGWWNGQESAADVSGLGNHGVFVGGASYAEGNVARAFNLNGASDYVAVSRSFTPAVRNAVTFAAWINPAQTSGDRPIVSKQNSQNYQSSWNWGIENGKLRLSLYQDPRFSFSRTARTVDSIPIGSWIFVAATFTPDSDIRFFINGVPAAATIDANSSQINFIQNSSAPVRIGAVAANFTNADPSSFFGGIIDEAQIYNRALSASEIRAIYNAGAAGVCPGGVFTPIAANGKIAFNGNGANGGDIFTINNDGTNQTVVSNSTADEVSAEYSPDGSRILYAADANANIDIYVVNADGTGTIRLTSNEAADDMPSWSPDGSRIVFASTRETGIYQIYVMNADGSNQTRLTSSDAIDSFPRFSPDGSRIAFVSNRSGGNDIWVMNADGSNAFNLTNSAADDFEPTWSPDGLRIAFTGNQIGNGEIWAINIDGANPVNLTNNQAEDYQPAWSPDGNRIVFASDRTGNIDVFTMNADGSVQTPTAANPTDDSFPSWQAVRADVSIVLNPSVQVKFASVQQSGYTVATALNQAQLPGAPLPAGYSFFPGSPMYDLRSSASYSGATIATFRVSNVADAAACSRLKSLRYEASAWSSDGNAAPIFNSATRVCTISQTVSALSSFVVVQFGNSIAGQITLNGNPLPNATVNLSGAAMSSTQTDAMGNYSFIGLESNRDYAVSPAAANYLFTPPLAPFVSLNANQRADFAAAQCSYSISPNGTNAPANASNNSFSLNTSPGCAWTAIANDNWLGIVGNASGVGSGTIQYSVAANPGAVRTGSIGVGGQSFSVTQAATSYSVEGTITYGTTPADQPAKSVAGVSLTVQGAPAVAGATDSNGAYRLLNLIAGGNYVVTPVKTGQINGITAFDATLVLRCVAAGTNCALTTNQRIAADANFNDQLSAFDATQILRFVAAGAASPNTGQVGNWRFAPDRQTYTALAGSRSGENYEAILVGEVNGNWTPPSTSPSEIETGVQIAPISETVRMRATNALKIISLQ